MSNAPIRLDDVPERERFPGYHGRFIHTGSMSLVYWDVEPGKAFPEHAHPHEQVVNLLDGEFELTIDGTAHQLSAGGVAVIPPNVTHSGRSITACRILDVFSPVREDYR